VHKVLAFSLVSLGLSACNNHTDDSPSKIINMKDNHKQHEKINTYIYEYNEIICKLNTEQDQTTAHLRFKKLLKKGEFKHEVRQFQKPYDNQQAEQISLMV